MKRNLLLVMVFSFALVTYSFAQRMVSGTVSSAEDGESIPGVNVVLKGTTTGTTTDLDGNYKLEVPEDGGTLVFTFIGMSSKEVAIGARSVVDVKLDSDVKQLTEVVVTAMGIEKESKELGYAITTVGGDELTKVRSSNVIQNLSGRVAGVRVNSSSGTAGGGVNIQIRGASSLSGTSQPLFVVDGTPISNSAFAGSRNEIISGGADIGNRAADLNPDDIATMTVLKGASAVALYGQRARDGVIIITTKKGKGELKVDINSTVRVSSPFVLPDFQNSYASGDYGQYDTDAFSNGWGPSLSAVEGQDFKQFPYDGNLRPLQAYPDNVKDFFENGLTLINNISVSQGTDKGDFRVSYTNFNEQGIVPNNELERNTLSFNAGTSLAEKLSARAVINYVRTEGVGRPRQGSNTPTRVISSVYGLQRTHDINLLKDNLRDENGVPIAIDGNGTSNNPYWIVEETPFNNQVDRLYGNFSLNYMPMDWITITTRGGLDVVNETRRNIVAKGTKSAQQGNYEDRDIYRREFTYDLFARASRQVSSDVELNFTVGYQLNEIVNERTRLFASDLVLSNLYNPANALSVSNERFESIRRLFGAYGELGASYRDFLFLTVTGRNDWSSTLPKANNSFFYPGTSVSFVFSEAFDMPSFLSFGKLRGSYAQVGSDTNPYQLDFLFEPVSQVFTQFLPNDNTFPHGGQSGFEGPDLLPAGQALVPQRQNTWEVGGEVQFYGGRFGFDVAYYNIETTDQIVNRSVAQSTGFDAETINIGTIENKGFEINLFGSPVKTGNFEWSINANFSNNQQTVKELAPGLDDLALTSGFSGLSIRAEKGQSFGLYGAGWLRSPDGDLVINATTGERERGERVRLGNINPDWLLGVVNTISYKGLTLSALVDISHGGVLWSATAQGLRGAGLAKETLENRGRIFIDQGVNKVEDTGGNVTYVTNETPVRSMQDFWNTYTDGSNTEGSVFDASFIKLREVSLSYSLPKSVIANTPFKRVSIGVEVRNLWLIDSKVPHVDPESSFFGPSLAGGQANVEFWSVPSARSIGGNLRLTF